MFITSIDLTYISPCEPFFNILANYLNDFNLIYSVDKWCKSAIQIKPSKLDDLTGIFNISPAIKLFCFLLCWAIFNKGMHLSIPITYILGLTSIFLPLPHPTSATILPFFICWRKLATLGQGLYLVYEKCSAIRS